MFWFFKRFDTFNIIKNLAQARLKTGRLRSRNNWPRSEQMLKSYFYLFNLIISEVKAQSQVELRARVLSALKSKTEVVEMKVSQSGMEKTNAFRYSLTESDPKTLEIYDLSSNLRVDFSELSKIGVNSDVLAYSFFISGNAKPFGFSKKYHITYTPVVSESGGLSHFLVYYDKSHFYPTKVVYYNGSKKITTIEYSEYKKIKNKVWRAHMITSENHLNKKLTKIEFAKINIDSVEVPPKLGQQVSPDPNL